MARREGAEKVGRVLKGTTKSISFHFGFHDWACLFPVDAELLEICACSGSGTEGLRTWMIVPSLSGKVVETRLCELSTRRRVFHSRILRRRLAVQCCSSAEPLSAVRLHQLHHRGAFDCFGSEKP